jgi:hypothetical protein
VCGGDVFWLSRKDKDEEEEEEEEEEVECNF